MTAPKFFDHQTVSHSGDEAERAMRPELAGPIAAEAAWQLPDSPQAISDDARWQGPLNATPRVQMMLGLQQTVGNQAVQRMMAQRRGHGSFAVDDDTQARIRRERSSGQPLDPAVQVQMSRSIGHDFSDVRVHTSTEADALSQRLGAIAFTNGHDVFFRAGRYDPASSAGQELLAHELAHVVQQSSGAVGTHQRMTVNPPDDAYEQAADSVAQQVMSANARSRPAAPVATSAVQREAMPEEEEELQTKVDSSALIQREELPEEEEEIHPKVDPSAVIQREEIPEEEQPLQARIDPSAAIQRQAVPEEEEEIQTKVDPGAVIQREEIPEEEEQPLQTKVDSGAVIQRQTVPEEEEPLQAKVDPGGWLQRQDDRGNTGDVLVPPAVPSVSGTAELTSLDGEDPYFAQAFGKWSFKADGLTTADFLAPTFTTTNEKAAPAKGCDGCDDRDCFTVTANAVITFDVNINVNLPSGSDFTDMKECEQKQIQHAIDTILKPHEQRHVAAFKTYKGKVTKPVRAKACRDDVQSGAALTAAAETAANAEGSTRNASARAASKKLDPFVVDVDLKNCEDKVSGDLGQPSDVAVA
jgi:hypothetical protein